MGRFDWERKGRGGTWCGILPMVKTKLPVMDSSETWEPTTLILKQSGYQIKDSKSLSLDTLIAEKFPKDLSIKIPSGRSNQFVLTCSNGYSYRLSTYNDVRMRDTLVLTMRMFQRYFWTCRMRDTLVLTMRMFQRRCRTG